MANEQEWLTRENWSGQEGHNANNHTLFSLFLLLCPLSLKQEL